MAGKEEAGGKKMEVRMDTMRGKTDSTARVASCSQLEAVAAAMETIMPSTGTGGSGKLFE